MPDGTSEDLETLATADAGDRGRNLGGRSSIVAACEVDLDHDGPAPTEPERPPVPGSTTRFFGLGIPNTLSSVSDLTRRAEFDRQLRLFFRAWLVGSWHYSAMDDSAIETYRYLRIGMVGTVLLLTVSVVIERTKVGCWQTSVSAYYYTPVRAIFVGGLLALGLALLVIKGRTPFEDICLNIAGMLAPIVAAIPTTDVGKCWSVEPGPSPTTKTGGFAGWTAANIDNNLRSLLIAGFTGLVVAALIATVKERSATAVFTLGKRSLRVGLAVTLVFLVAGFALFEGFGEDFTRRAHGASAVLMFAFLALAVGSNVRHHKTLEGDQKYVVPYGIICVLMVVSAGLFATHWNHKVLAIEILEIALFAAFWSVQTYEHWHDING